MNHQIESVQRIEPTRLSPPNEAISDLVAELAAASAVLGKALHPRTAANLAHLVRVMNTYYSNLIEGHNTRPRDIERALNGDLDKNEERRNLQIEAAAHVRVQFEIDRAAAEGKLQDPVSIEFIRKLHKDFYKNMPPEYLKIEGAGRAFTMEPGEWRSRAEHDVEVGQHVPPSSDRVDDFMKYFVTTYTRELESGRVGKTVAVALAHHRFNYIHPFPDGNGRVSRLLSHAMAHATGIGAHGLWSISRGLARGLESRSDYKRMMALADMPRQGSLDGRGNLSLKATEEYTEWFLRVCLDQISFMTSLFDLEDLRRRLRFYVERNQALAPESASLLEEALIRGKFERGELGRITGLPGRTARRVFSDVMATGLLGSETPRGSVSLRFPVDSLEILFPRLFPET